MNRRKKNPYEEFAKRRKGRLTVKAPSGDMFLPKKKKKPMFRVLLVFLIPLFAAGGIYNMFINAMVRVEAVSITLSDLPSAFEGYSILHLSDLYGASLGEGQEKLKTILEKSKYSVVCITGDMAGSDGDAQAFYDLLDLLPEGVLTLFIPGEQDPEPLKANASLSESLLDAYVTGAQAHGAIYLDAPYCVQRHGQRIWFAPESAITLNLEASEATIQRQLDKEKKSNNNSTEAQLRQRALEYQLERMGRIRVAREEMRDEDIVIVLTHAPLEEDYLQDGQEAVQRDLVLAGHYNGGQACLPVVGPVYVPGKGFFPGKKGVAGYEDVQGVQQYISPGLGVHAGHIIPMRLFNPPTASLITLTSKAGA